MKRFLQYLILFVIFLWNIQISIAQTWTFGKNVANTSYTAFSAKMAKGTDGSIFIGDTYIDTVIIGSQTYKPVNSDFFITKQDSSGKLVWSISDKGLPVGNTPSSFQCALACLSGDNSGNVFAFGHWGYTLNTANRIFLAKYNSNGVKQWNAWAQSASLVAALTATCTDNNGNVYISGHTANTITFYNGDGLTTQPNNVIVTGGTEFLAKYSSSGIFQWVKEYNSTTWPTRVYSLTSTNDGILLCGYTDGGGTVNFGNNVSMVVNNSKKAAFIVKYNNDGLAQWVLKAEGTDRPYISIAVDNNSNVIMCGKLNAGSIGTFTTTSVVSVGFVGKVNSSGTPQWVNFDETSAFMYTQRIGVAVNNTSILVAGTWYNNGFITIQRFDIAGKYIAVDSVRSSIIKANVFLTTSNGSFFLSGNYCGTLKKGNINLFSTCGIGKVNLFVTKIAPTGGILITGVNEIVGGDVPTHFVLEQNYPNPFNPTTSISFSVPQLSFVTLKVFDVIGKEIATLVNENKSVGNYEVNFDASKLSSGIYFYKLQTGNFSSTKKMVLMK